MKKAVLNTVRVNSLFDVEMIKLKNSVIGEAAGVEHFADVEEVTTGGYVVTIWVDDAVVESGEYIGKMLGALARIEAAFQTLEGSLDSLGKLNDADAMLNTPQGRAAEDQVKKFFNMG
jgi:hypothetical protein